MQGRTQVAYNGSFGISTVYKNLKMLSGDEFRSVASERGISILDKGNNTSRKKYNRQVCNRIITSLSMEAPARRATVYHLVLWIVRG